MYILPSNNSINEILFEQPAPSFASVQQRLPEGFHVKSEPLIEDGLHLKLLNFKVQVLKSVNLV